MGTHPRHSARKGQYKLRRDEDDKICDLSFPSHRSRPIYHSCSSKEGSNGLRGSVRFCSGSLFKCKGRRQACKKGRSHFGENLFLKKSSTLFPTPDSLLVVSLVVQTQWTRCRRGARMGWWPTSTPPPRPTSRCSLPSAGSPPSPTSRPRSLGRSPARQRWRRRLHI